jgi:hypothetical protein
MGDTESSSVNEVTNSDEPGKSGGVRMLDSRSSEGRTPRTIEPATIQRIALRDDPLQRLVKRPFEN